MVVGTMGNARIIFASAPTPAERRVRVKAPWKESGASTYGVPVTALEAYREAARAVRESCAVPWTLLAAIGRVETDHGRYGGSRLGTDGLSRPLIRGVALNGKGPVMAIRDSDRGQLDGDRVWDRAVGPMQFIPTTWASWASDGDGDGVSDPDDLDDAAFAAARYLCRWSSSLTLETNQRGAVRTYNNDGYYVDLVLAYEAGYRTGVFALPDPPATAEELQERRERREARKERRQERLEQRREVKAEQRAAAKAQRQRDKQAKQPRVEADPASTPQPKGQPKGQPKAKPTPPPKSEPKPDPKSEPKPDPKSEPKPDPKPEPTSDPKPQPPEPSVAPGEAEAGS